MPILTRIRTAAEAVRTGARAAFAYAPAVSGTDPYTRRNTAWLPHDARQQAILTSPEALYGRTTYFVGEVAANTPLYQPGLNPQHIAAIHVEVDTTGRMIQKADLDMLILRRDAHLRGVDHARRVGTAGRKFRVEAANLSEKAQVLRDLGEALFDDIDAFDSSIYSLLKCIGSGYGCGEVIYADKGLHVGEGVTIPGAWPQQIDEVANRNFRFHPVTGLPVLEQTGGHYVTLDPACKFIWHETVGDGPARQRGHLYQTIWLHLFKQQAIAKWAHCLEFYGIPTPFAELDVGMFENPEYKNAVLAQLQRWGLGQAFVKLKDYNFGSTETPSGLDSRGMHGAFIGWCNAEQSKVVQGETLTTEMGGVGGYNTASVHENTKESFVKMDERKLRETMRTFLRNVFRLNAARICRALSPRIAGGLTPEDLLIHAPRPYWLVEIDATPQTRLDMILKAADAGLDLDDQQVYRENGWDRARTPSRRIRGTAVTVSDGAQVLGAAAATAGADNPKDEPDQPATAPQQAEGTPLKLDPTATAQGAVVTVDEARKSMGLPPLGGPEGGMTLNDFIAKNPGGAPQAPPVEARDGR